MVRIYATQRNATRNQSTVDFERKNLFTFGNRYQEGVLVNNLGEEMEARDGFLVVRNSGTFETATITFVDLANDETVIIAGLTYTADGAKTAAEVATAFSNLAVGYVGAGDFAGTLTGYSTGEVVEGAKVVFTASTVGNKTDLTASGTGGAGTIVIVNGSAGTVNGVSPATSANLANVIGVLCYDDKDLADGETSQCNYAVSGDIDASLLVLPVGVNLESIVGSKALRDVLTGLGFVLHNVTENSKFDN